MIVTVAATDSDVVAGGTTKVTATRYKKELIELTDLRDKVTKSEVVNAAT